MFLLGLFLFVLLPGRSRHPLIRRLLAENLALRQQLAVLQRKRPAHLHVRRMDRIFWIWLSRIWPRWHSVCRLVKPATVLAWHRAGFRLYWRWKSRKKPGRPNTRQDLIALIKRMARENPGWGGARIHGELAKLGFLVSESTVHRYLPKRPPTPKQVQAWRTFLRNHRDFIAAMDFLVVPTWTIRQDWRIGPAA